MADKFQIRIDSILGGHTNLTHFSSNDQFLWSLGIDPYASPDDDTTDVNIYNAPSGLIRPLSTILEDTTDAASEIRWMESSPKGDEKIYVYDGVGSVYSMNTTFTITGLKSLTDDGSATGNGMAYYDNYMYFARDTTIARYGPLDGTPSWTTNYWAGTLGLTELSNTTYPSQDGTYEFPNHILHRHSDGILYIVDVVDNQGTIHYIKTTKTTVEGDTDNGSTYDKLNLGYGLWVTSVESYGTDLVLGILEGDPASSVLKRKKRAKVAFWDTTSQKVNQITWVEYPDAIISAIKNVNGVLYFTSSNYGSSGFRVMQYIGGNSFKEVAKIRRSYLPLQGAVDGIGDRLYFGASSDIPFDSNNYTKSALYALGLDGALFNIMKTSATQGAISAIYFPANYDLSYQYPAMGDREGNIWSPFRNSTSGFNNEPYWFSQIYKIGRPFKITSIRLPFVEAIETGKELIPTIIFDNNRTTKTLTTINNTNYSGKQNIVIRPENAVGNNNFCLQLKWTTNTTKMMAIELPIIIEYELVGDN